jgi:hypothetical protein
MVYPKPKMFHPFQCSICTPLSRGIQIAKYCTKHNLDYDWYETPKNTLRKIFSFVKMYD